jgi:hypothetical protein
MVNEAEAEVRRRAVIGAIDARLEAARRAITMATTDLGRSLAPAPEVKPAAQSFGWAGWSEMTRATRYDHDQNR